MGDRTGIEWCDATFNPWIGCQKVSAGCDHCYAEAQMDHRLRRVEWGPHGARKRTSAPYWSAPIRWNAQAQREGRRMRVFCASLADWLDNRVPDSWREDLAAMIEATPSLDWLLLTKRVENWDKHAPWHDDDVQPNVTIGVTIEDESALFRRANFLHGMAISGWRTFVSHEPALGRVDWAPWLHERAIGQLIMGGESGPGARPMHPDWARGARDQCVAAGVPFFFKQWGEWLPWEPEHGPCWIAQNGRSEDHQALFPVDFDGDPRWNDGLWAIDGKVGQAAFQRVGKKCAGRLLDGREWNEMPRAREAS